MTIGVKTLVECVNNSIDTASPLGILQLSSVNKDFDEGFVYSVANLASLPDAANNKGRLIFVQETCVYRYSDGTEWTNDSSSIAENFVVFSWGRNTYGQLGDNTAVNNSSPALILGGFTDWCQVSASIGHSIGVRTNGTAWAWGRNGKGNLGDNSVINRSSPVSVVGGFTDWCQVSVGYQHDFAIRTNGSLWSWGTNLQGQLGNNIATTISRSSPVSVVGGFTDWCQVSAGRFHGLALRTNGTVWSWGFGGSGRLGDNSTVNKSSPVSVVGGFTDWCQVSAGNHSLGIRTNGTLWAWGYNGYGNLGDGTTANRSSPVSVVGGFTDWCQVSSSTNSHSLALRTNGTAWAWGYNNYRGQVGDGTIVNRSSPVSVIGGFTDWCQISAGYNHSMGLRTNGTIWAWGSNYSSSLGVGDSTDRSSPTLVLGGITSWCRISSGEGHNLAIRSTKGF
jgi:alpha-tubulin suppressor-like RCC1 family protein